MRDRSPALEEQDLHALLRFIVAMLEARRHRRPEPPSPVTEHPALDRPYGCFVTWRDLADHNLRGCVGGVDSGDRELSTLPGMAVSMALAAATQDPRFHPVPMEDMPSLHLSVTVLGRLEAWSYPRDPDQLAIGREGLKVAQGARQGLLLPQVAVEWEYDGARFLDATCVKAGLERGRWRSADVDVYRFHGVELGRPYRELIG